MAIEKYKDPSDGQWKNLTDLAAGPPGPQGIQGPAGPKGDVGDKEIYLQGPYVVRVRRGSSSVWAALNPILSDGEPGYDTSLRSYKIGDGVTPWNDLSFASSSSSPLPPGGSIGQVLGKLEDLDYVAGWIDLDPVIDEKISTHEAANDPHPQYAADIDLTNHVNHQDPHTNYVKKSGDTMTGQLTLPAAMPSDIQAARADWVKQWDANHAAAADPHTGYVKADGSRAMTGPLILPGNPGSSLHAATKDYVDTGLAGKAASSHGHTALTTELTIPANAAAGATYNGTLWLAAPNTRGQVRQNSSGQLIPMSVGAPSAANDAVTKTYADAIAARMGSGNFSTGTLTANARNTFTVPFNKTFSAVPWVVCQAMTGISTWLDVYWWVTNITTTQFQLDVWRGNTTAMVFAWIAIVP